MPAILVPGNHRLSLIPIVPGTPGPGHEVSTLRTVAGCPRRGPLYGMEPHRAPTNRVLTAGACNPQLRTRGCADRRTSLTTKYDNAVGGSTGDPQIPPWARKDVCWASISSIPQAWPCHTATCAPAAQPLKLAYFQGCCLRNDPLGKPSPTILALTAAHNGVAERKEGGIRSRRIKGCTVSWR